MYLYSALSSFYKIPLGLFGGDFWLPGLGYTSPGCSVGRGRFLKFDGSFCSTTFLSALVHERLDRRSGSLGILYSRCSLGAYSFPCGVESQSGNSYVPIPSSALSLYPCSPIPPELPLLLLSILWLLLSCTSIGPHLSSVCAWPNMAVVCVCQYSAKLSIGVRFTHLSASSAFSHPLGRFHLGIGQARQSTASSPCAVVSTLSASGSYARAARLSIFSCLHFRDNKQKAA